MARLSFRRGRSSSAEEKKEQSGSISKQGAKQVKPGCMALFFGVFLLAGLGFAIPILILPVWKIVDALSWEPLPCEIVSSDVSSHSDSDGTTYSIDVRYRYEVGGQSYESDRYNFIGGSSSGYDGKAEVVAGLPEGSTTTCYVDPEDPTEAVIHRGFSWEMLFGFLPLIFIAVGAGGIVWVLRGGAGAATAGRRKRAWLPARARPKPPAEAERFGPETGFRIASEPELAGAAGPVELEPAAGPIGKLVGITFVCLFWNGIVSVFLWQVIKSWKSGDVDWCLSIFLIPFVLVGLLLLLGVPYQFLALFNPRPHLSLSRTTVPLGGSAELEWRFSGAAGRIRHLRIVLEGKEVATYRRGTSTYTDKETFAEIVIADRPSVAGIARGAATVEVPQGTMHSFEAGHNKIEWRLKLSGDIARWPDVLEEYPFVVLPMEAKR